MDTCCSRRPQKYPAAGRDPGGTTTGPPLPRHHLRGPRNPPDRGPGRGVPLASEGLQARSWGHQGRGTWGQRDSRGQRGGGRAGPPPPGCLAASSPWDSWGRTGHRTASPRPQDSQSLSPPGPRLSLPDTCLCRGWTGSDTRARSLGRANPMLSPQAGLGHAQGVCLGWGGGEWPKNNPAAAQLGPSHKREGPRSSPTRARPARLGQGMGTRRG